MGNLSIVTKIVASACGIVSVMLILGSLALIKFEINLIEAFTNEHLQKINRSIDEREEEERASLQKNVRFNAEILAGMSVLFLDNFNPDGLKQSLYAYMNYSEIIAIKVLDEDEEPFAAAWKSPDIMLDNALPEDIELDERLSVQVNAMRAGKKWGSLQVYYTEDIIADKIKIARKNALSESEEFRNASQSRLNRAIVSQCIGIFVILVILILCLTISLRHLVLSPLKMVSETARKLSEFNLTVWVDTRRQDEIGMMFVAIDHMVAAFRKIVSDVKSGGKRLAHASGQMKKNIVTIASAAEEMSTGVREISRTTGHMSQNMNAVAASIEEMSASINRVGETARRGSDIAKDAVLMAEKARNTMSLLGEAANRIGEVTEVIKRIADKTTLLALNADIEAASAGKAGKGFAVVANEIKSFARQSTRAADEIAARILLTQKNTEHAVSVIGDVSGIIHTMNSSSETISSALEEQMAVVKDIAANAVQADTRAKDIAASMVQLSQGANDVSIHVGMAASGTDDDMAYHESDMNYMDTSAAEVERLAGELLELVDKFKME